MVNYKKVYEYLIDCIEDSDGNLEGATPKERIEYLFSEFDRVANHPYNLQRIPNHQERLADYLMGLPFGFDYENYKILEIAKEWESIPQDATEKQEDKILSNWWSFIACNLMQIRENSPKFSKIAREYQEGVA